MDLQRRYGDHRPWLSGWTLAAVILCVGAGAAALAQDFAEPDNAMRLVRVRDMLGGQGWFDNVQHRLNPPAGTPMHWAQWIDAVLAGPILLMSPLVGEQAAEIAMAFLWPLGLLAAFMYFVGRIAGELGAADGMRREAQWIGAIVGALAFPATEKFAPGSFDHHNVEIVCGLAAIWWLMGMREKPERAQWAGAALGLALATAAEGAPLVVAGLVVAGALWLLRPAEFAAGLGRLGLGLALTSGAMFILLVPPAEWETTVCDAMGAPFLGLGLIGGGIAHALSSLPQPLGRTFIGRLGASALISAVGLFVLARLFPECLGGGYAALGEDMSKLWMAQISETRSLVGLLGDDPAMSLSVAGAAFVGLLAAGLYLRRHWREPGGWIVLVFLLVGWAVLVWQIRGSAFATAFAIPFAAWLVALARRGYRSKASVMRALGFVAAAFAAPAAAWAGAGEALQARFTDAAVLDGYQARVAGAKACTRPDALRALRAAPQGVIVNQFSLGAGVLVWTQHGVLAGPYHRNVDGTMTMISAMRASPEVARGIVQASPADYVLVCPAAPETRFYAQNALDGVRPDQTLSAMLGRGEHPGWLAPVDIGPSGLSLYRVLR